MYTKPLESTAQLALAMDKFLISVSSSTAYIAIGRSNAHNFKTRPMM